jgi:hypothetical protein
MGVGAVASRNRARRGGGRRLRLSLGEDDNEVWRDLCRNPPGWRQFCPSLCRSPLADTRYASRLRFAIWTKLAPSGARSYMSIRPKSVLPHAQLIGVVDVVAPTNPDDMYRPEIFESASTDTIPGTVFLSPNSLANSWRAFTAWSRTGFLRLEQHCTCTFKIRPLGDQRQ